MTRYLEKIHRGQYERGLRHGLGIFLFLNGDRYEGEFFKGEIHGRGKMTWIDGTTFEGLWKRGKIRQGLKVWKDRSEEYDGAFNEEGLPHGFGIFRYSNGDYYRGFFKHGVPNGKGEKFTNQQGTLTYCEYEKGKMKHDSRILVTRGHRFCFVGQRDLKDDDNHPNETLLTFGRFDGDDAEVDEQDQIQVRLGYFHYDSKVFPPSLKRGTYSTATSKVTSQSFGDGPVVMEGTSAAFHDIETGNVRWAWLGPSGIGPIGKSLFVFANGNTRLELYREEGVLSEFRNL